MATDPEQIQCIICAAPALEEIPAYLELPRVTSDCKPWLAGGRLGVCRSCGTVQKYDDAAWQAEAQAIYRDYEIYHQSAGKEQGVFNPATGAPSPRSERVAHHLDTHLGLPQEGSLLDVGCGSGVTLTAFSRVKPTWALYGYDLDQRQLPLLRALANFRQLYTGDSADIPGEYSVVSLIHATEHIPDPLAALRALAPRLRRDGRLLIQVPNYRLNPFDLAVADHLLHFSLTTLVKLVETAGFAVELASDSVVPKELTLTALSPGAARAAAVSGARDDPPVAILRRVTQQVAWLQAVIARAREVAAEGPLGIFGTSIAGAWIYGALGDDIAFFVDEDPNRVGRSFMGRPVLSAEQVPAPAQVYIPLAPIVAANIAQRYAGAPLRLCLPPELSAQ